MPLDGAERVIVSQIVRSPGVYYDKKTDKAYNSTYGTTVIPYHGAWLEYETDLNDIFQPSTTLMAPDIEASEGGPLVLYVSELTRDGAQVIPVNHKYNDSLCETVES